MLQQAVILDPSNDLARDLYVSVVEVSQIEEISDQGNSVALLGPGITSRTRPMEEPAGASEMGSVGDAPPTDAETPAPDPGEELPPRTAEDTAVESDAQADPASEGSRRDFRPDRQTGMVAAAGQGSSLELSVGPEFTLARSNAVPDVDSDVSLAGVRAKMLYVPGFQARRFGAALDYSGGVLKTSGEERIVFRLHRLSATALIRWKLTPGTSGELVVGARGGYDLLLMENLEDSGAYNFTQLYGPSAGVFISDPVLFRLIDRPFLESVRLNAGADLQYLPGEGEDGPVIPWRFHIGVTREGAVLDYEMRFRHHRIVQDDLQERFTDIAVTVGYEF